MPTHYRVLSLPLLALLASPLATGCNQQELPKEDPIPRVLYAFESCDDLLDYAKENAKESLDEYGSIYGGDYFEGQPLNDGGQEGDSGGEGTGGGDGGVPGVDYSETNVQELGVDEPDLVKTDGDRIVALAQGQLHHVDATGTPTLTASLPVEYGYGAELFLYEDRVLLFQRVDGGYYWGEGDVLPGDGEEPLPQPAPLPAEVQAWLNGTWTPITKITEIDISDPAALKIVANLYVSGDYLSARRQDAVSRVVLRSTPTGLQFKDPWQILEAMDPPPPQPETQEEWEALWAELIAAAKEANAAIIDASTIDNWVPHYVFEDVQGGKTTSGLLLECVDAMHPGVYSGLTMTSVLTIDLEKGLSPFGGVGLFADGAIVYASTDNLYVATSAWQGFDAWGDAPGVVDVDVDPGDGIPPEPGTSSSTSATGGGAAEPAPDADPRAISFRAGDEEEGLTSYIHKFATPADDKAIYRSSGEVRGRLLNQWAMHEARGDLRVATTDQQGWDIDTWESFVTVLRDDGEGELGEIGQVGGLGMGEEIKSVRYIGDVGYVVTFRQTDPLYTVDLKDHEHPAVAGELKINGYSAYLHPLDATHLIGVGFDGTPEGQLLGVQVNLFDVSDIQSPIRTSQQALGDFGWTEVAFDHHAFLYWEPTDLAVFPVNSFSFDEELMLESYFMGAAAYTVDPEAGVQPFGTITHIVDPNDPWLAGDPTLRRSLVIGDLLYTVSESGLKASALADLADKAWLEW
ncbi:MAG: beta-propeller domain-containing protein [Myxococcales bacterium]|nr:beta-propeller domain-containing protein [Myxococcales bacterium]